MFFGVILDDIGMILIGVNVVVKGIFIGIILDIDGSYSLEFFVGE